MEDRGLGMGDRGFGIQWAIEDRDRGSGIGDGGLRIADRAFGIGD